MTSIVSGVLVLLFILVLVDGMISVGLFIGYAFTLIISPESESVAGKSYWDCWLDFHRILWKA